MNATSENAVIRRLMVLRAQLAMQAEIPDALEYGNEWRRLARRFRLLGLRANASFCYAHARQYRALGRDAFRFEPRKGYVAMVPVR